MSTDVKSPVLSIDDLTIEVRQGQEWRPAVRNLSMDLMPGEVTALVGESGSGKSLTAMSTIGLLAPETVRVASGSIKLAGEELIGAPESRLQQLRGNQMTMVFQEPMTALNPLVKVGQQIADVVMAHNETTRKAAVERAHECLELVGIPKARAGAYPHELSGGMRQRVLIAMAVACEPVFLIADEPTTALDVTVQAQVLDLLGEMVDRFDMAMLFISHDFGVVAEVADRVHVLLKGDVVESGPVEDIFANPTHDYTINLMTTARGEWLSDQNLIEVGENE